MGSSDGACGDRLLWLEQVVEATGRAAEELREVDHAQLRRLLDDLDELHARLSAELAAEG